MNTFLEKQLRAKEIKLFLTEIHINDWKTSQILLNAFNTFKSTPGQIRAIQKLEESINPYILSDFANGYKVDINGLDSYAEDDFMYISVRV